MGRCLSLCISWLGSIGGSVSLWLLRQPTDAAMAEKRHPPTTCLMMKGQAWVQMHFSHPQSTEINLAQYQNLAF
ncbi:hypothetical protein MRB53_033795 [Persea americana]|uniref:Uncharacterized protein n=1 Tax=Persea americana TaxID=3435 RepID=A0ACC2KWB1_PERAE|nr:hypothetical protein MRB53_033795 [Persea americana]